MPLVRAVMSADTSTSTSTAAVVVTFELPSRDSSTRSPSIHTPGPTSPLLDPKDGAPPSSTDATQATL